jgi:hypothetical protein
MYQFILIYVTYNYWDKYKAVMRYMYYQQSKTLLWNTFYS